MVGQNKKKTTLQAFLYILPALIIIIAFVIYPLIHTVRMSFYSEFNIFKRVGSGFGLDSYIRVLKDSSFRKAVANTFIYAFVTVPVSLVFSLIIAILLNSGIKGAKFFQTAYFLPYVTNAIAIGLAFRFIFHSQYGILNKFLGLFGIHAIQWLNDPHWAMPALCIFGIWSGMAFKIVIFLAGLQGIDKQLYQAARIDEASRWSQFVHITVPQLAPITSYQLVIAIIGAFKAYVEVIGLFGDAGPIDAAMTMVYYMFEQFYAKSHYTEAAASGVLMFLIIMLFTIIQLKLSNRKAAQ
jgi:multiple sugar transport system permease protein